MRELHNDFGNLKGYEGKLSSQNMYFKNHKIILRNEWCNSVRNEPRTKSLKSKKTDIMM